MSDNSVKQIKLQTAPVDGELLSYDAATETFNNVSPSAATTLWTKYVVPLADLADGNELNSTAEITIATIAADTFVDKVALKVTQVWDDPGGGVTMTVVIDSDTAISVGLDAEAAGDYTISAQGTLDAIQALATSRPLKVAIDYGVNTLGDATTGEVEIYVRSQALP